MSIRQSDQQRLLGAHPKLDFPTGARRFTWFLAWVFCFAAAILRAGEATLPNYFVRTWQSEDGLPLNAVTAIVQTHDGYLWMGTRNGLAQFDGAHFQVWDSSNTPELQSRHVTSLFEDSRNTLWIGFEDGELVNYRDGEFHGVPVQAAWHRGKILNIGADEAGDIWLLNQSGELARLRDGLVLAPRAGTVVHLVSMAKKPQGGFWIQWDTEVFLLTQGKLEPLALFDEMTTSRYVQGIGAARDGGLWVMVENRMRKWKDGRWAGDRGQAPWGWNVVQTMLETKEGYLAAGTADAGLFIVGTNGESRQFCLTNGFSADWITSLWQDREGSLWAATGNGGLTMMRPANVLTLTPPDRWKGRTVLSVTPGPGGDLWIGTEGAGVYRLRDGEWTSYDLRDGLGSYYVWSLAFDEDGRLWVGTWGTGLFLMQSNRFTHVPVPGNTTAATPALLRSRTGDMWVGSQEGLLLYGATNVTRFGSEQGLVSPDVRTMLEDNEGALWFGMAGGGLGCLKDGVLRQLRRSDGLSSDFVQSLHFDQAGALWIGTFGGGLSRLKNGRFSVISTKQGLANNVICHIEEDDLGYVWMSSFGGILRINKAELDRCAEGLIPTVKCTAYSRSDGMPTLECSGGLQPAGCKTSDGRIWFPTSRGLVVIDPQNVKFNRVPPPVLVEELLVDGHALGGAWKRGVPLRIPPGRQRFEFHYTGLSFATPEKVRFRYRLEGLENEWIEAGTKRSANYSHVQPGSYLFRVMACNGDDVWNEEGASLAFTVLPYFWQTWWFRAVVIFTLVAGGGGAVWLDARRRMRRKLERIERQRAIERERARIANDIHDDLGATLTRITLLSQSARRRMDDPREATVELDRIYDTARELTRTMDEIVWAVNPRHDTLDSLASYLGKFAQDYLRAAGIRCRLNMPVQLPNWPLTAELRHNVFLSVKEALNNVVKHSAASVVRVTLTLGPSSFTLTVEDNGHGFVPPITTGEINSDPDRLANGNGLANIKCRLDEIGGRFEIKNTPQAGVTLRFEVPVRLQS